MNRNVRLSTGVLREWLWPPDAARHYLSILLLLFAVKQVLTVLIFPPFSGHDEIAHFDYIRTIVDEHRLPRIPELDDWRGAAALITLSAHGDP